MRVPFFPVTGKCVKLVEERKSEIPRHLAVLDVLEEAGRSSTHTSPIQMENQNRKDEVVWELRETFHFSVGGCDVSLLLSVFKSELESFTGIYSSQQEASGNRCGET